MKRFLILCILALIARAQEFPNPLNLPDGRIVWNPSRELCLQYGEVVTNTTEASVVTNYPANYAARLALVPMYITSASNLGVLGMSPMEARAALKQRAAAETNMAARVAIVEAATDLIFLRESIAKLGVDLSAISTACDVTMTTNAAATNVIYRIKP